MGDISFELQAQLLPVLRSGKLAACEKAVAARLANLPDSPFHCLLDLAIANSPKQVAEFFDGFFRQLPGENIKAAYTEMNGFEFNAWRWYCDAFAYQEYGGHGDYEWLADWRFDSGLDDLTIIGLEPLQQVYASDLAWEGEQGDAGDVAALLVIIRFQDLIRRSAPFMRNLRFPLLSAAHDYDFIDEVRP